MIPLQFKYCVQSLTLIHLWQDEKAFYSAVLMQKCCSSGFKSSACVWLWGWFTTMSLPVRLHIKMMTNTKYWIIVSDTEIFKCM